MSKFNWDDFETVGDTDPTEQIDNGFDFNKFEDVDAPRDMSVLPETSAGGAFGANVLQGVTAGLSDEMEAGGKALFNSIGQAFEQGNLDELYKLGEEYDLTLPEVRERYDAYQKQHPVASTMGNIAGSAVLGLVPGGAPTRVALAGLSGLGTSDVSVSDALSDSNKAMSLAKDIGLGATFGLGGEAVSGVAGKIGKSNVGQLFKKGLEGKNLASEAGKNASDKALSNLSSEVVESISGRIKKLGIQKDDILKNSTDRLDTAALRTQLEDDILNNVRDKNLQQQLLKKLDDYVAKGLDIDPATGVASISEKQFVSGEGGKLSLSKLQKLKDDFKKLGKSRASDPAEADFFQRAYGKTSSVMKGQDVDKELIEPRFLKDLDSITDLDTKLRKLNQAKDLLGVKSTGSFTNPKVSQTARKQLSRVIESSGKEGTSTAATDKSLLDETYRFLEEADPELAGKLGSKIKLMADERKLISETNTPFNLSWSGAVRSLGKGAAHTGSALSPIAPTVKGIGSIADTALKHGARASQTQFKEDVRKSESPLSGSLFNMDDNSLRQISERLANDPSLAKYGENLNKALNDSNQQSKNAILFAIAQNPTARRLLSDGN